MVDLSDSHDREAMWYLEVMEAYNLFYRRLMEGWERERWKPNYVQHFPWSNSYQLCSTFENPLLTCIKSKNVWKRTWIMSKNVWKCTCIMSSMLKLLVHGICKHNSCIKHNQQPYTNVLAWFFYLSARTVSALQRSSSIDANWADRICYRLLC